MKFKTYVTAFVCLMGNFFVFSQEKSTIKFGKISQLDFDLPRTKVIDSNTNAVILSDIGSTGFIGNTKGWFTLVFTRHTRIKIINKKAFDLATVSIGLYVRDADEEKLEDLKASTFNLEEGKVVETKLGKKDLFEDKIDKNHTYKKFTLPAVKEGSILEYSYTVKSDFDFHLRPWEFQSVEYPCLWSEYQVNIPSLMIYVFLPQGFDPFYIKTAEVGQANYRISQPSETYNMTNLEQVYSVNANTNKYRWVMKDVPPLLEENFSSTGRNFIDKIEFQEAKISGDGITYKNVMNDWPKATEDLLKREDFGYPISQSNFWIKDALSLLKLEGAEPLEQAKRIYYYLEDNLTCRNHYNYFIETSLRDVFKKRTGNVGEINLLLIAMLREEGLNADPVLLSTKDYGLNYEQYPLLERFNYLICKLKVAGRTIYLDASHPRLGFGCLPAYCYNGHARIISEKDSGSVYFYADSINEKKLTSVIMINEGKGVWGGSFQRNLGYMESYELREKIAKETEKVYFKDIQTTLGQDLRIDNSGIDSLNQLENPVKIHYDFTYNHEGNTEFIYFYPMISAGMNENQNPFKAMERKYPVEFSYPMDVTYILNLEVPDGYNVEEMPKSVKVTFNTTEGFFEYMIQKYEDHIQFRSRIKLDRTAYSPDEYNVLRDFFAVIVKKQNEQIVFKKKN